VKELLDSVPDLPATNASRLSLPPFWRAFLMQLIFRDFQCRSCERPHSLLFREGVGELERLYTYTCPVTQSMVAFVLTLPPRPATFVPPDSVECRLLTM